MTISWIEPKKRSWCGYTIVPDDIEFGTIERDGKIIYDSRADVPCDMTVYKTKLQEHRAAHEQRIREEEEYRRNHPLPPGVRIDYGQHRQFDSDEDLDVRRGAPSCDGVNGMAYRRSTTH